MLSVAKAIFCVCDPVCDQSVTLPAGRGRVYALISSALPLEGSRGMPIRSEADKEHHRSSNAVV